MQYKRTYHLFYRKAESELYEAFAPTYMYRGDHTRVWKKKRERTPTPIKAKNKTGRIA